MLQEGCGGRTQKGYAPSYWGMVFPLGMYTTCTWNLALVLDIPFLLAVPRYFIYLAFAGWIATFAGLVNVLLKNMLLKPFQLFAQANK